MATKYRVKAVSKNICNGYPRVYVNIGGDVVGIIVSKAAYDRVLIK